MKISFCIFFIALLLVSCGENVDNKQTISNAQSVDNIKIWAGRYFGVLPCADCNRIELEIVLLHDFSYQMKTERIGSIQAASQIVNGKFKWRFDGDGLIQLDEKGDNMVFFVSTDGKLEMRSQDGLAFPNYKGEICHLNKLTEK